jgi:vacuolar-type H+-ATPase subunit H
MNKFEQLGYEFGATGFTQKAIARQLLDLTSNKFASEVSVDLRLDLCKGLALRYAENHAELNQGYILQGENFIKADDKEFVAFKGAKYQMSVKNLLSIDKTEISKLAQLDKPRHTLVKEPRTKAMAYLTDTVKDMQKVAKDILSEINGETKPRKANLNFEEAVTAMLFDAKGGLMKKAINAKASSDNSYNEARWVASMLAFKNVWLDKNYTTKKA